MGALATLFSRIRGVPTGRILGRQTSGTGRAEALTAAELRTLASLYSQAEVNQLIAAGDTHIIPYWVNTSMFASSWSVSNSISYLQLIANRIYSSPFVVSRQMTITQAAVSVTIGVAGASIRLGIRNCGVSTGEPTTLVTGGDFGEVDAASSGTKIITDLSVTLYPGLYFLQCVSNSTPTVNANGSGTTPNFCGSIASSGTVSLIKSLFRATTYGALSSDESGLSQSVSPNAFPWVGVR